MNSEGIDASVFAALLRAHVEPQSAHAPAGYEDVCENNSDGWPVWTPLAWGGPPCGHEDCTEPYHPEEPAMALQCPGCDRPGCDYCMPAGRHCLCPACEEGWDE